MGGLEQDVKAGNSTISQASFQIKVLLSHLNCVVNFHLTFGNFSSARLNLSTIACSLGIKGILFHNFVFIKSIKLSFVYQKIK
ncbi:MAG: hypothetical protein LBQ24_04080 [Candidatus Peribacteria bacterium]|nr:hypothetical protein [Candidatus Peribacteria bacterium]